MSLLTILKHPHPVLRQRGAAVTQIDDDIRQLAGDMAETMRHAQGIGLAAPQVGRALRLMVIDINRGQGGAPLALANPTIIHSEGSNAIEEGCLSVPGVVALVKRAACVRVRALNMDGQEIELDADELLAICLQHEIDHLNGVLFFDHISRFKRSRLLKKYEKLKNEPPDAAQQESERRRIVDGYFTDTKQ